MLGPTILGFFFPGIHNWLFNAFEVEGKLISVVYWFGLLFTTLFETVGTLLAAKLIKKDWLSSFNLAVAMNTRGGPGIVLATVAFGLGIINQTFFVTLVLIAIITSLLAGYWFKYVLSKGLTLLKN